MPSLIYGSLQKIFWHHDWLEWLLKGIDYFCDLGREKLSVIACNPRQRPTTTLHATIYQYNFTLVYSTFTTSVASCSSKAHPPLCEEIHRNGAELNTRFESILPTIVTFCEENSVTPPCFGIMTKTSERRAYGCAFSPRLHRENPSFLIPSQPLPFHPSLNHLKCAELYTNNDSVIVRADKAAPSCPQLQFLDPFNRSLCQTTVAAGNGFDLGSIKRY
ncbi:hypothetical protein J6590_009706 [Homalodisca vitripennis]|nr:hypothetical protein J6590_009706 [Homalodisca vitripennis]